MNTLLRPLTDGKPPFTAAESRQLESALCRGASALDLVKLLMDFRGGLRSGLQSSEEFQLQRETEFQLYQIVFPRWLAFREKIEREYDRLPRHVHASIRAIALDGLPRDLSRRAKSRLVYDYYWRLRADYCNAGFTDPEKLFKRISAPKITFLGIEVQSGVHQVYAKALQCLEKRMPEHVQRTVRRQLDRKSVSKEGKDADLPGEIMGFQPRRIARSQKLSNHAFGLAIDINPEANPHITHRDVIKALKEITTGLPGAPDGYDFGARLVRPAEGEKADIAELHKRARAASDRVRDWILETLGEEATSTMRVRLNHEEVEQAKRKLAKAIKENLPISEIEELRKAHSDAEKELKQAKADHANDPDLKRLRLLRRHVGRATVDENWARDGIVNVPLELVTALKTIPCMRWGFEYEESKDSMHFELVVKMDHETGEVHCPESPNGDFCEEKPIAPLR